MQAELREFLTIEHGDPYELGIIDGSFRVTLRVLIGSVGTEGADSFDFDVCSPMWLQAELSRRPIVSGRFLLIVDRFDPAAIESYVRNQIAQASGKDWSQVASKLARWSHWEFEDYVE